MTTITVSHPSLPSGFSGNLDAFITWMDQNATFATSGSGLNGQIGGTIDKTQDNGLWVNVPDRTFEAWDSASASYVTVGGVPIGALMPYAGVNISNPPANWLFCEGQAVPRSGVNGYPELFAVIGTAYGHTSDSDFKLPDFRGRGVIGADSISPDSSGYTTGDAGLSSSPSGTGRLPSYPAGSYVGSVSPYNAQIAVGGAPGNKIPLNSVMIPSTTGNITYVTNPAIVLRWLIKYR